MGDLCAMPYMYYKVATDAVTLSSLLSKDGHPWPLAADISRSSGQKITTQVASTGLGGHPYLSCRTIMS